jgi:hypothetical protein
MRPARFPRCLLVLAALLAGGEAAAQPSPATAPAPSSTAPTFDNCPMIGWPELLPGYLKPDALFPTEDTKNLPTPDCAFHQWSWEAFVWATALNPQGVPRFLTLPTPADLLSDAASAGAAGPRPLRLGARAVMPEADGAFTEDAGAIVEADGNMLVAPNGYPVYASVHMNASYFATVKRNLIVTGGYTSQPADDFFDVGAAVFKAMWLRLDPGQPPPAGAFVTQAEVPVLAAYRTKTTLTVAATKQTVTVPVALVGLHVVGYTVNHPEFLWGTFEHQDNSPKFADNTFDPTSTASDPKSYTFYQGGTPWNHINYNQGNQSAPFLLKFDVATQKFTTVTVPNNVANFTYNGTSPSNSRGTNVVLANQTGSETNSPNGPGNIAALNQAVKTFYRQQPAPQSTFGSYFLVGTVWMSPNSYSLTSNNTNAVGSVNLVNTTAETFFQVPKVVPTNATPSNNTMLNCFLCHNATSFNFQSSPPKLPARRIALSHVLAAGSPYAVPNVLPVLIPPPQGTPAQVESVAAPAPRRQ